ncbi:MAG: nucleoside hydrolase [Eubacteriales bacterium]|nr:nucleoside hydrolase [Eubacteriales bacterium]
MKKWNYDFDVPDQKKVRMIVHTDCKNEADDQFAVAHHLMTPKFIVKGIIAGHFNKHPQQYGAGHTAQASYDEVQKVLKLMDVEGICPVVKGSEYEMADEKTPIESDGARLIIEEAMKDDPHPLFVAFQGAITDLACAILLKPEICSRMTAIWIGGGAYPEGGREFNLAQDIAAANVVMKSEMPLWQIPINVYKQMGVSLAELQYNVKPCGKIGEYLFRQMVEFNNTHTDYILWPHGEIWGLGDSPTISVLLEESERTDIYDEIPAPTISYEDLSYSFEQENRKIRVYKQINARLTMNDFYAKLALNYREN